MRWKWMPLNVNSGGRDYLVPEWPAPAGVRAVSTTRTGGCSGSPYDSFNLGRRAGEDENGVTRNRALLVEDLSLVGEPRWLRQVHGIGVVGDDAGEREPRADACVTETPGVACAVLTADCLPVLFCASNGREVGAAHAGWRGLVAGVLEATVDRFSQSAGTLMAWMGPAIGPRAFEVGDEVRDAFMAADPGCSPCFTPSPAGRWLADLRGLAARRLRRHGIERVYGGGICTFGEPRRFYSYRRDGVTGRMASLVWIDPVG